MMRAIAFVFHVFVVSGSFQHILVAFVVCAGRFLDIPEVQVNDNFFCS